MDEVFDFFRPGTKHGAIQTMTPPMKQITSMHDGGGEGRLPRACTKETGGTHQWID